MVKSQNWVREFLARPVKYAPGTHFVYNSGATYLCSAIVQKVTGQPLLEYLTPRLLQPLGITGATWESCPMGIHIGGWGLSVPTDALVKFGQLYLQKGKWQDRQLLPEKWVAEATSKKIQQPAPEKPSRPNEKNDWLQGYGYQFWRCQHGAYRGDGAFGQFCVVLPEQNLVMVLTGETNDMQGVLDAAWNTLLPALGSKPLAEDPAAQEKLATKLKSLVLPVVVDMQNKQAASFSGKKFRLEANTAGLEEAEITFSEERTKLVLRDAKQEHSLESGTSKLIFGEATFPPPPRLVSGGAAKPGTKHKVAIRVAERKSLRHGLPLPRNPAPPAHSMRISRQQNQHLLHKQHFTPFRGPRQTPPAPHGYLRVNAVGKR
jgi:hypothetical protein